MQQQTFTRRTVVAGAAAALATGGAAQARPRRSRASSSLSLGVFQNPDSLDPAVTGLIVVGFIDSNVFDYLIYRTSSSDKYYPGLATSWQVSPNVTTYTLKLRPGVRFHDGTPFDAAAVKANFDHVADPATKSRSAIGELGPYKGAKVVDAHTVQVQFKQPYAAFLDELTQPLGMMSSPAAIKKYGNGYTTHPVGTGPFMFKDYTPSQQVTLVKNPDYRWGPAFFRRKGAAALDQIVFKILPDAGARANALRTGELALSENLNPQDAVSLLKDKKFKQFAVTTTGVPYSIPINAQKAPTDDLRVRQAIFYATDQKSIVQTLFFGIYEPAYQAFTPVSSAYDPKLDHLYRYDPKKAGQLLDAAGWKLGSGGIREKDGKKLSLSFINIAGFGFDGISQLMQAQLKKVGIDTTISDQSFPAVASAYNRGDHNLSNFFYYDVDPASVMHALFGCDQIKAGFNWAHYCNPSLDRLVTRMNATRNAAARAALYRQGSRILMENAVLLPIYNLRSFWVGSSSIKGLQFTRVGYPYFHDVTL